MSEQANIFKGTRAELVSADIDAPLADAKERCCEYYVSRYAVAAQKAREMGDTNASEVYSFLGVIVSFLPSFDTPAEPFLPLFQLDGKRGLIPSDLSSDDIAAVRELARLTKDPALCARLFDVLWELTKDHKACAEAAACYITAGERLNTEEGWTFAVKCYHRGLYLAARLGRSKDLFMRAVESLQRSARLAAKDIEKFRCCQYLRLLTRFECGDPAEFAPIAAGIAQKALSEGDPYRARHYWEAEAEFHKLAKNQAAEKAARLAAAEAYVVEAENRAKDAGGSCMAAAAILVNGIEALRRSGAAHERIEELRMRLGKYQASSLKEMKVFSSVVDISKLVESARERVKSANLREALFELTFGHPLSDPKELRETVIKAAKEFPLAHLVSAAIIDEKGRTAAKKEGFLHLEGEALEEELEAEMFSHAARFSWPFRVSGYVEPARLQILNDHHPTFADLLFIVQDNPFVPPGHEGIFLRGIHAGFHGDFLITSHLLVPQIENSLRYVLESHGVDISNLMSDGTQPVKVLGPLFGMAETKKIFGKALCFELRGCLIEKTGFDFRNHVAHGFVSEAECYSVAAEMIWWLVLRICLTPIIQSPA